MEKARVQKAIKAGLADSEAGRTVPVEEIRKEFDLNKTSSREIKLAWALEVEDRIDAFERGEMKSIPLDEAFKRLKQRRNQ